MIAAETTSSGQPAPSAIVVPFVRSVRDMFQTMLSMEVTIGKPYRKTGSHGAPYVSGVIGFSGQLTGCVVVGFPRNVANILVEKFAGAAMDDSTPDFADAIGEITNILVGSAKSAMEMKVSISIPSVIIGTGYTVAGLSAIPCFIIPCSCAAGEFTIEISVQ